MSDKKDTPRKQPARAAKEKKKKGTTQQPSHIMRTRSAQGKRKPDEESGDEETILEEPQKSETEKEAPANPVRSPGKTTPKKKRDETGEDKEELERKNDLLIFSLVYFST
jgi:hypothetical protein